jgi:hypothetical protein
MPPRARAKSAACRAVMCSAVGFTAMPGAGHGSGRACCERSIVAGLSSLLQSHTYLVSIPDDAASRQLMRHTRRDARKAGADARPPDSRTKDM